MPVGKQKQKSAQIKLTWLEKKKTKKQQQQKKQRRKGYSL